MLWRRAFWEVGAFWLTRAVSVWQLTRPGFFTICPTDAARLRVAISQPSGPLGMRA